MAERRLTDHQPRIDPHNRLRQRPEVIQPPQRPNPREILLGFSWDETGQRFDILGYRSGEITRRVKSDEHLVEITRPGLIEL